MKTKRKPKGQGAAPVQEAPVATRSGGRTKALIALGIAILVAAAGALLYAPSSSQASRPGLASLHAPSIGDEGAKVHIVEFLDPACETCATFYPLIKQLMAENPNRIRVSIRHAPFHGGSEPVVAFLEASRKQGKYWQALEALFARQDQWTINHTAHPDRALQVLAGAGLNVDQLLADMKAPEVEQRMTLDRIDTALLGVTKTPEYFVNGRQMQTFGRQQLQSLVRDEIRKAY